MSADRGASAVTAATPARQLAANPLDAYRDDGPLARWIGRAVGGRFETREAAMTVAGLLPVLVVLAWPAHSLPTGVAAAGLALGVLVMSLGAHDVGHGRLAWLVPAMLRVAEYGGLIKLTALTAPGAMPACYALLAVLAFHHYDAVYRLRHQQVAPPAWTRTATGGWDGRLLVAAVLALAGALEPVLIGAAIVLGIAYGGDSIASWLRFVHAERPAAYEDEDLEDA
jgi:hypothetical protein